MAFVKKTWKDRISQYPNRRTITDENGVTKPVTVGRAEGEVTQEGDAFSASNMNDLEVRIESAFASGGGGGGGGHTILDDSGTALPQRAGLQFKGAYSEDNSTDGITEVNVIRNMTKAEFDLLTDDEKKGIINITNITSGSDDRFQPIIYSEEERVVGVWTDGKPLYEKTITGTTDSSNLETQVNHGISNLDTVVSIEGSIRCGTQWQTFIEHSRPNNEEYTRISDTIISIVSTDSDWRGKPFHFTLRYTKTTDTPGSGQWTPQGVPAHHYSTDEQVVGTWVDGKTLYEKTIYNAGGTSGVWIFNHNISNLEMITEANGGCIVHGYSDYSQISWQTLPRTSPDSANIGIVGISNSSISMYVNDAFGNRVTDIYITLRYTKSST